MYDVITFDCYGTLIDWEAGIAQAISTAARAAGVSVRRDEVMRAYLEVEPAVQAAEYRSYREVLCQAAARTAALLGWSVKPEHAEFLADSLPQWHPFPDTNDALRQLKADGYRLGILSNVDDGLLEGTLRNLSVDFDFLVTAESVRSYKPACGHFLQARKIVGGARWLHAAQSYFHDVEPARELDVPVVWVNRNGEVPSGEARPTAEVADLMGLVRWLRAATRTL